jgi:hypothetical protein
VSGFGGDSVVLIAASLLSFLLQDNTRAAVTQY